MGPVLKNHITQLLITFVMEPTMALPGHFRKEKNYLLCSSIKYGYTDLSTKHLRNSTEGRAMD